MDFLKELERFAVQSEDEKEVEMIAKKAKEIMLKVRADSLNDDEVCEELMKAFPMIDSDRFMELWPKIEERVNQLLRR